MNGNEIIGGIFIALCAYLIGYFVGKDEIKEKGNMP